MGEGGGRSAPVADSAGWKTNLSADCRRRIVEKLISTQLIGMENISQTCVVNCFAVRGPNRCSNPASTTMQSQIKIKNERKLPIPLVKQSESCQKSTLPASIKEYAQNSSNNSLNEKGDQLSDLTNAWTQQLFGRQKQYQNSEQQENNYQEQQELLTYYRNQKKRQQGNTESILYSYHLPQQPLLL